MKNKIWIFADSYPDSWLSEKNTQADHGNAVPALSLFSLTNSYPLVKVLWIVFIYLAPEIEISFDTGNGSELLSKIS